MASIERTSIRRRGMAAVAAAVVCTALAVASSVPAWAAAQPTPSPTGASARGQMMGGNSGVSVHGFLRDNKGGLTPIDAPDAAVETVPSGLDSRGQRVGLIAI
jgi:hypothetical protein